MIVYDRSDVESAKEQLEISLRANKRGSARDIALFGVILFALAITFFIINFAGNTMIDGVVSHPEVNSSNASVTAFQDAQEQLNRADYYFFGIFIALILALLITGWFVGGHPIFMFAYFIVVLISVVLATIMSNVWETVSQASVFGNTVTHFTITNHIILYLPIYVAVIGILGLIVMFAKPYVSQEGYQ